MSVPLTEIINTRNVHDELFENLITRDDNIIVETKKYIQDLQHIFSLVLLLYYYYLYFKKYTTYTLLCTIITHLLKPLFFER